TEEHFAFTGYIPGFDPGSLDRNRLREELGYGDEIGRASCRERVRSGVEGGYEKRKRSKSHSSCGMLIGENVGDSWLVEDILCEVNLVFHNISFHDVFVIIILSLLFFFSSRRRHTRWPRDWSSDVCSSDLDGGALCVHGLHPRLRSRLARPQPPARGTRLRR